MKSNKKIIVLALTVIVLLLCTGCTQGKEMELTLSEAQMSVRVIPTGKSDCILIDIEGFRVMIDCGDEDDLERICSCLGNEEDGGIDLLIITHYDNDHIGSAAGIIEKYSVGTVVMPDYVRHSKPVRKMLEALEEKQEINKIKLKQNDHTVVTKSGVTIEISSAKGDYGVDDNANSLISVITLKNAEKLLFTGDATKERLGEFFEDNTDKYVFAKMPHHGGYNSTVKALLTQRGLMYAAVTVESLEDADIRTLNLAKKTSIKTLFTCDGEIYLLYKDGQFKYYQIKE